MLGGVSFSFLDSTTELRRSDPALTKIMSLERHLLAGSLRQWMAKVPGSPGNDVPFPLVADIVIKKLMSVLCVQSFLGKPFLHENLGDGSSYHASKKYKGAHHGKEVGCFLVVNVRWRKHILTKKDEESAG